VLSHSILLQLKSPTRDGIELATCPLPAIPATRAQHPPTPTTHTHTPPHSHSPSPRLPSRPFVAMGVAGSLPFGGGDRPHQTSLRRVPFCLPSWPVRGHKRCPPPVNATVGSTPPPGPASVLTRSRFVHTLRRHREEPVLAFVIASRSICRCSGGPLHPRRTMFSYCERGYMQGRAWSRALHRRPLPHVSALSRMGVGAVIDQICTFMPLTSAFPSSPSTIRIWGLCNFAISVFLRLTATAAPTRPPPLACGL
jgi:hypothetical protein